MAHSLPPARQVALQIALPELDGAIEPIIFAGRDGVTGRSIPQHDRIEVLAGRAINWARLARKKNADKKVGIYHGPCDGTLSRPRTLIIQKATYDSPFRPGGHHCLLIPTRQGKRRHRRLPKRLCLYLRVPQSPPPNNPPPSPPPTHHHHQQQQQHMKKTTPPRARANARSTCTRTKRRACARVQPITHAPLAPGTAPAVTPRRSSLKLKDPAPLLVIRSAPMRCRPCRRMVTM